jgi:hypothetical protein
VDFPHPLGPMRTTRQSSGRVRYISGRRIEAKRHMPGISRKIGVHCENGQIAA